MVKSIGIISDPHAKVDPLKQGLEFFVQRKVDDIVCLGDVAGYGNQLDETIALLQDYKVQTIAGNHEKWLIKNKSKSAKLKTKTIDYLNELPIVLKKELAGVVLYCVHAQPPDLIEGGIRLRDQQGNLDPLQIDKWQDNLQQYHNQFDVLMVGHTHQVFAEYIADILVINPGSCLYNHSCAILTLPDKTVEWIGLSNQPIKKSWHWGNQVN